MSSTATGRSRAFPGGAVVQLLDGRAHDPAAIVARLHDATIVLQPDRVAAVDGEIEWSWLLDDIEAVHHGDAEWTILAVPGIPDYGVVVPPDLVDDFRRHLDALRPGNPARVHQDVTLDLDALDLWAGPTTAEGQLPTVRDPGAAGEFAPSTGGPGPLDRSEPPPEEPLAREPVDEGPVDEGPVDEGPVESARAVELPHRTDEGPSDPVTLVSVAPTPVGGLDASPVSPPRAHRPGRWRRRERGRSADAVERAPALASLEAREISAWFGTHHVLDRVSLLMPAGQVTALIGPSGCGKSTFLRILNRMHELIPSASLAGEVLLEDHDVYDLDRKLTDARREIGMVFQKPNPFPAMSIYDNVVASLRLTGTKATTDRKDELVEACLSKAGLWNEVKDRLRSPGGGLSGGQQQRLCIARALAIRPRVLLMDEPCSALDPTSTRRIEQTIHELKEEVTIVIVTHNMQQAARVSDQCAFFLAEQGTPGVIVEHGPTEAMFHAPQDTRTSDYVNGRFG